VRELLPGELLLNQLRSGKQSDANTILRDVLDQLTALEAAGLFHDDLRTWNILIGADGHATLIDYGAISAKTDDRVWPGNVFLSFMIFVNEILKIDPARPFFFRTEALNPDEFPEPYRSIFWHFLNLPAKEWRFASLHDCFFKPMAKDFRAPSTPLNGLALALQALSDVCKMHQDKIKEMALSQTKV
jgi:O-antigen chain-terminating methyltransferase